MHTFAVSLVNSRRYRGVCRGCRFGWRLRAWGAGRRRGRTAADVVSWSTSLVLGIMAIVRIRGEPQLSGIWLGVSAVLVSGGVIGSVAWVFSQWGAHY